MENLILEAQKQIEQNNESLKLKEQAVKILESDLRKKENELSEKIRELTWEKNRINSIFREEIEKEKEQYYEYVKNNSDKIKQYNKVLLMMEENNIIPDLTFDIESGKGSYQIIDDNFYDTDTLKMKVLISTNDKPKNRFTLVIVGKSKFTFDIFPNYSNDYGTHVRMKNHRNAIIHILRESDTEEALKSWYEKNKNKIKLPFLKEHEETAKLYEWTKENTHKRGWEIEFLNRKKAYYENFYRGTETPEYKEIISKLDQLLYENLDY